MPKSRLDCVTGSPEPPTLAAGRAFSGTVSATMNGFVDRHICLTSSPGMS
jgi:hypothetical protein